MKVLIIEIPNEETDLVTRFVEKIGGRVTNTQDARDSEFATNAPETNASEDIHRRKENSAENSIDSVEAKIKLQKKSRVKEQLLTGLETGLKQAKEIQAGKSKGFSISEIVNGK